MRFNDYRVPAAESLSNEDVAPFTAIPDISHVFFLQKVHVEYLIFSLFFSGCTLHGGVHNLRDLRDTEHKTEQEEARQN